VLVPFALVLALAVLWTGLWFYVAAAAETAIINWRSREARLGRVHDCARQQIGGFPFRIEVRCADPSVELRRDVTPFVVKAVDLLVAVQVYQPRLLISEFSGPMTIAAPGQPPEYRIDWTFGQSSLRGTPRAPERVSVVIDEPIARRAKDNALLLQARKIELHGRIAEGSLAGGNPVVDLVLRAAAAVAPQLHPAAAAPTDVEINATLHGLTDLAPKPWPMRFREMAARGGRIEIASARLQQGDMIATSTGVLALAESGNIQGQLQMTVVGLEALLNALGIDQVMSQGKLAASIDSLDRLVPGLAAIARQRAAPTIVAGIGAIGKRTVLDGHPAVTVPVRFADGRIMLGPFPVAQIPPLF
jgi:hypothetical protein